MLSNSALSQPSRHGNAFVQREWAFPLSRKSHWKLADTSSRHHNKTKAISLEAAIPEWRYACAEFCNGSLASCNLFCLPVSAAVHTSMCFEPNGCSSTQISSNDNDVINCGLTHERSNRTFP
jgi:hypothetical protein